MEVFPLHFEHLPTMVQLEKNVIAWCLTHKSKCVIYLTVGDGCGVFLLHRMYGAEGVVTFTNAYRNQCMSTKSHS